MNTLAKPCKWREVTPAEDYPDLRTEQRILIGRLTKRRYLALRRIMRNMGAVLQGTCGHDWDCCGCLLGTYANMQIQHYLGGWKITLARSQSFNY